MTGLIVLLALGPDYQALRGASGLGLVLAIVYLFSGLSLLIRAHFWAGRAGPIQRLIPHVRGRACGFLAAIPCQRGVAMRYCTRSEALSRKSTLTYQWT